VADLSAPSAVPPALTNGLGGRLMTADDLAIRETRGALERPGRDADGVDGRAVRDLFGW
jgi:hypothetical protein